MGKSTKITPIICCKCGKNKKDSIEVFFRYSYKTDKVRQYIVCCSCKDKAESTTLTYILDTMPSYGNWVYINKKEE